MTGSKSVIQKKIDEQSIEQHRLLINSTGEARERLEGLAEVINRAREALCEVNASDEDDLTDRESVDLTTDDLSDDDCL